MLIWRQIGSAEYGEDGLWTILIEHRQVGSAGNWWWTWQLTYGDGLVCEGKHAQRDVVLTHSRVAYEAFKGLKEFQ